MEREHDNIGSEDNTWDTIGVFKTHLCPTSHIKNDAYDDEAAELSLRL
jgi:hypothetical protein